MKSIFPAVPVRTLMAGVLVSLASVSAVAAPTAVVEGVQMPAWVERGGVKQPRQRPSRI